MKRKGRASVDRHRQILEMHSGGYGIRAISKTLHMCKKTVRKYLLLPVKGSLSGSAEGLAANGVAPDPSLNLEEVTKDCPEWFKNLDLEHLLCEIKKGVSYKTLFREFQLEDKSYWLFWKWSKALLHLANPKHPKLTLKLTHKPGEKTFVDYTDGLEFTNLTTGEIFKTQLFVGTLPFSSLVFAEFTLSQKLESFICSHERMWQSFGGVTKYTVPDNLKSAVTRAHRYDPDTNKSFCDYANFAGFAALPARPFKPKDKANVECHVGLVQRLFFEEVRNIKFTSLAELNKSLHVFLEKLNHSVMKDHGVSRLQRFEVERPFLKTPPEELFEIPIAKEAKVHPDCHIQFLGNFYSVPFIHVGKTVRAVKCRGQVEIYNQYSLEKITTHTEAIGRHKYKTIELHYPQHQAECKNFSIEVALREAEKIGIETKKLFTLMFEGKFPLKFLRPAQGILRLAKMNGITTNALEYASIQALQHGQYRVKYIEYCARYFTKGLRLANEKNEAPVRNRAQIFLQQDIKSKEKDNL